MRRNQTNCGYNPSVASYYPVNEGMGSSQSKCQSRCIYLVESAEYGD